jgi:hypothetical protein
MPLQARVLERWSDGSIRWVLLDFQASVTGSTPVRLRFGPGSLPTVDAPISVSTRSTSTILSNGLIGVTLNPHGAFPFADVQCGGRPVLDVAHSRLIVRSSDGHELPIRIASVEVEERGPVRAAVTLTGRVEAPAPLRVTLRIEAFAGLAALRLRLTLHNPGAAVHRGGYWELGDPGSVLLRHVGFQLALPNDGSPLELTCSPEKGAARERFETPFRLHQESSGKPQWKSRVHVNRDDVVPLRMAGYRLASGPNERHGAHASPAIEVARGGQRLTVTSRLFWEVFPKAYAVAGDGSLHVELLPGDCADLHELQGGEQFVAELAWAFGSGAVAEWIRAPAVACVDPRWWAAAGDVLYLTPVQDSTAPYERLIAAAIEGDDTFFHKRDVIDEYGWRHYGDFYADHENGASSDKPPIVSHYNNQYDGVAGCLVQFMRSGNTRWWELARDLASHVAHIDIYWTDEDKSAYNGGLFWHTCHHVDARRSTHRCYPRANGVQGGGPSIEQNYSTGLMLHYFMTGDLTSRESVLRLARWAAEMDDGRRTLFRFLSRAPTGHVSATGAVDYHGPGRGPANAIHTFLNAYRVTADRCWVRLAEALIARCIHPADDLLERNLLDAERRWYYTVFLQALGRYLAFKSELGEEDRTWHYARASLLHYARWMAAHEYPYLEKPDILEFPTETWAAQDMRKCEVFDLAGQYASDLSERDVFVERAEFFFRSSSDTLQEWPTRTRTRPVVLMLSNGYSHLGHEAHRADIPLLLPSPPLDFGAPQAFEPQKVIALRRAKRAAVVAAALAIAGVLSLL